MANKFALIGQETMIFTKVESLILNQIKMESFDTTHLFYLVLFVHSINAKSSLRTVNA